MPDPRSLTVGRSVRFCLLALLVSFILVGPDGGPARAQDENKILTVTKDALYGGAAGLLLGGVLTLVVEPEKRDDTVRWGIVLGTFGGFGYGIYEVSRGADEFAAGSFAAGRFAAASERAAAPSPAELAWNLDRLERARDGMKARSSWNIAPTSTRQIGRLAAACVSNGGSHGN